MTAYQRKILKNIAKATCSRDESQRKAWEYAGTMEDMARTYLEDVKVWNGWIENLRKLASEENLTEKQINNAIQRNKRK